MGNPLGWYPCPSISRNTATTLISKHGSAAQSTLFEQHCRYLWGSIHQALLFFAALELPLGPFGLTLLRVGVSNSTCRHDFTPRYRGDVYCSDAGDGILQLLHFVYPSIHSLEHPDYRADDDHCLAGDRRGPDPEGLHVRHQQTTVSVCWSDHHELHCDGTCRRLCDDFLPSWKLESGYP